MWLYRLKGARSFHPYLSSNKRRIGRGCTSAATDWLRSPSSRKIVASSAARTVPAWRSSTRTGSAPAKAQPEAASGPMRSRRPSITRSRAGWRRSPSMASGQRAALCSWVLPSGTSTPNGVVIHSVTSGLFRRQREIRPCGGGRAALLFVNPVPSPASRVADGMRGQGAWRMGFVV